MLWKSGWVYFQSTRTGIEIKSPTASKISAVQSNITLRSSSWRMKFIHHSVSIANRVSRMALNSVSVLLKCQIETWIFFYLFFLLNRTGRALQQIEKRGRASPFKNGLVRTLISISHKFLLPIRIVSILLVGTSTCNTWSLLYTIKGISKTQIFIYIQLHPLETMHYMYADWHNFAHNHIQTPCLIQLFTILPSNVIIDKFNITKKHS